MAQLKIYLFGATRIYLDDLPVHIVRRKAMAMLAYLAVTGKPHERDTLGAIFWPESADSRNQVRVALSTLRSALGMEWLVENGNLVQITNADSIWIDVRVFKALYANHDEDALLCIERYEQALTLVEGTFMAGFSLRDCPMFDDWIAYEQLDLERKTAQMVSSLIDCHRELGNIERAIELAELLIVNDPLDEESYRLLMALQLHNRNLPGVLQVYEACARMLYQELGLSPGHEIETLRQQALVQRYGETQANHLDELSNETIPYIGHAFVGRETETRLILRHLAHHDRRIISLVGIGGIGKTHLAAHIHEQFPVHFAFKSHFVGLDSVRSADQALLTLAARLQIRLVKDAPVLDQVIARLKREPLLLVLDNVEQLVPHINPLLVQIMQQTERVKILVTSRVMLHLHEEHVVRLEGLIYPKAQQRLSLPTLQVYDSIDFFVHWVQRRVPHFELTEHNIQAVAELCRILEGVPLAIRLAAVWCDLLSVNELLDEIRQNINMLQTNLTEIPEKHRSMQALFDSIWSQMTTTEQQAFTRLAIFQGGFTRHAAQQIMNVPPLVLKSLLDKSLLLVDHESNLRYHIHELLRLFALGQDTPSQDSSELNRLYVSYYATYVSVREADLKGRNQLQVLTEIDREFINIQHAWTLAIEHRDVFVLHVMLNGLYTYLRMRGYWNEGRQMFNQAMVMIASEAENDPHKHHLYNKLSARYYQSNQNTMAWLLSLIDAAQNHNDTAEVAHLTTELSWQAYFLGHIQLSLRYFTVALRQRRSAGDAPGRAEVLRGMALCSAALGRFTGAIVYNQQSITIRQRIGDQFGLAMNEALQGELLLIRRDISGAVTAMYRSYVFIEEKFSKYVALKQTKLLAWAMLFAGDLVMATQLAQMLIDVTDTPESDGEYVLGLLILALMASLDSEKDGEHDSEHERSNQLLQQCLYMLQEPQLRTGEGVFSRNLMLMAMSMIALIHALNGQRDVSRTLTTELLQNKFALRMPFVAHLLFTADVVCLLQERGDHLHANLRMWLHDQPWLSGYLKRF